MIDTHAHVYASEFDHDRDEVIARARQVGIEKILMPNIDVNSIAPCWQQKKLPRSLPLDDGTPPLLCGCQCKTDFSDHL